ncbi:MAG: hypothetical protein GY804_05460 [Alphaproteobacteria bacterium]|nr:hypothetical protein [Alphaproteobacteria bacterium]
MKGTKLLIAGLVVAAAVGASKANADVPLPDSVKDATVFVDGTGNFSYEERACDVPDDIKNEFDKGGLNCEGVNATLFSLQSGTDIYSFSSGDKHVGQIVKHSSGAIIENTFVNEVKEAAEAVQGR